MRRTARAKATWKVGGRDVVVSNLDKLFWPEQGLTKGDLLEFFRDIAPTLLPYLQDRPFIMRLWPDGISGKNFYRWRLPAHAPEWLRRFVYQLQTAQRTAEMLVVDDPAELIWVVNQGVIEMHPWVARRNDPEHPTWLFFDLDPVASVSFERVLEVASWIGEMLEALGLLGLPKTSAGDGLHIFVSLAPGYTFEEVRAWLGAFIEQLDRRYTVGSDHDVGVEQRQKRLEVATARQPGRPRPLLAGGCDRRQARWPLPEVGGVRGWPAAVPHSPSAPRPSRSLRRARRTGRAARTRLARREPAFRVPPAAPDRASRPAVLGARGRWHPRG